ncbi:MAG: energy-coupling factor transporter transmembrane protein EcfT [Oscillospiraceae bacterium]|jgi:cobalt/nickel transport system permease protein|nr:energy-coupling factor transporter transmembrane protein EcfT [Oscillospiraceae bacterium]
MPEWLSKPEGYAAARDRDTFIDRSVLALLSLISRLRTAGAEPAGRFAVDPFFRVAATLLLVVAVSLAREFASVYVTLTFVTVQLAALPSRALRGTLKFTLITTAFTFIVVLPSAFLGNRYSITMLPAKVFVSVAAVNILSRTARWDALTGALGRLRVPDIFVFLLDITVKYIFMLGEFVLQSLQALGLRSVGRNDRRYGSLSGVAGVLFLKSRQMAEETHWAMECRGFAGKYPRPARLRVGAADILYCAVSLAVLAAFVWIEVRA